MGFVQCHSDHICFIHYQSLRVGTLLPQFMLMILLSWETMLLVLFRWNVCSRKLLTLRIWVFFVTSFELRLLGLAMVSLSLNGSILLTFLRIQACLGVDLHLRLWYQIWRYQPSQGNYCQFHLSIRDLWVASFNWWIQDLILHLLLVLWASLCTCRVPVI